MRKITPSVWGEPLWKTIHIVALAYPQNPDPETKQVYRDFYMSLETVIPCQRCANGYSAIIEKYPVDDALSGPQDLFQWTVDVHNEVAKKLDQPLMTPEFVRNEYVFGTDASEDPSSQSFTGVICVSVALCFAVIAMLAVFAFKK